MLAVSLAGAMNGPVLSSAALVTGEQLLGSRSASAPGVSTERERALLAGATRLLSGYIERQGNNKLRLAVTEEDLSTGKSPRIVTATDSSPITALDEVARQLAPHPKPAITANTAALRLYAIALESPVPTGIDDLKQATKLDPNFGLAWAVLENLEVAQGDRAAAKDVLNRARQQKLDPLSLARLNLEASNIEGDQRARIEALRKVVELSPEDTSLRRSLAEAEMTAGQFTAAAGDFRKMAVAIPNEPGIWNEVGYALLYAGDFQGALAALGQYAQLLPKEANPQDSIGDVNYVSGHFDAAAERYLRAHQLQPEFERHGDLYKAAWAKFRAGDKTGADKSFAQFRMEREKVNDALIPLMVADWLYRTGRHREAVESLRKTVAETPSDSLRSNGYSLLTIWELLAHDRAQAARDSLLIGPKLSDAPMLVARFAALPSVSAEEWASRAEQLIPASMSGLRPLALTYALVLDGKREAARPVWEKVVESSPATDFFARALLARIEGKPREHPLIPDPANVNEFLAVLEAL